MAKSLLKSDSGTELARLDERQVKEVSAFSAGAPSPALPYSPSNTRECIGMPTDLMDLRKHIRRLYGMQQLCCINPCLVSLQNRQVYASFHFEQTTRPLREFTDSTKGRAHPVRLMIGQDRGEFLALVKQAEANFLACAQSMHAISQTLAHVLHFATGANFLAISVQPFYCSRSVGQEGAAVRRHRAPRRRTRKPSGPHLPG